MVGLLAAAIRDDDPVLVFEHKALYGMKGECPDGEHVLPLGQAAVLREGGDVTLVALSRTVAMCMEAAEELADDGISAEVIDLRTLVPLDAAAVLASARRTGRVVVAEENPGQLGWGAAISAILAEEAFHDLQAPIAAGHGGQHPAARGRTAGGRGVGVRRARRRRGAAAARRTTPGCRRVEHRLTAGACAGLQVAQRLVAGPEPGQLHEVLRVEEQLVHPAELRRS